MTYPTHSTSGPMSVMKARPVKVSAFGSKPRSSDPYFDDYAFSNVTGLFQMSNGSQMRICEYRELAYPLSDVFESELIKKVIAHRISNRRDSCPPPWPGPLSA
jgi:hypothetical protein